MKLGRKEERGGKNKIKMKAHENYNFTKTRDRNGVDIGEIIDPNLQYHFRNSKVLFQFLKEIQFR